MTLLPSGATPLDLLLGGGLQPGSMTEIFGPPASGKSTLALSFAACASRLGLVSALLDAEESFTPSMAARLSIDPARMLLINARPHTRALRIAEDLLRSAAHLLIIDSAAALSAPEEAGTWGDPATSITADMLRDSLIRLHDAAARNGAFVIIINQTRTAFDQANAPVEVAAAPGVHIFCQNRIHLESATPSLPGASGSGSLSSVPLRCTLLKHRNSFFSSECILRLYMARGFDTSENLVGHALSLGIIREGDLGLWLGDHLVGRDIRDAVRQTARSPFLDSLIRHTILTHL